MTACPLMRARSKTLICCAHAITAFVLAGIIAAASAQDGGRIKRKRLTAREAERLISETVMNDGSLKTGDVVATDRGFFVFEGVSPDGLTYEFRPIANPLPRTR